MRTAGSIGPVEHRRKAAVPWLPICRRTPISARFPFLNSLYSLNSLNSSRSDDSSNVQELVPSQMWRVEFITCSLTTCYADGLSVACNLILQRKTKQKLTLEEAFMYRTIDTLHEYRLRYPDTAAVPTLTQSGLLGLLLAAQDRRAAELLDGERCGNAFGALLPMLAALFGERLQPWNSITTPLLSRSLLALTPNPFPLVSSWPKKSAAMLSSER